MQRKDTYFSASAASTKKIAAQLAHKSITMQSDHARVLALSGDLGTGKTTFVQGFARALGMRAPMQSPTFVLMKLYAITKTRYVRHLVHIDAYRIERAEEMEHLGFYELLRDRDSVILIEWAERIKKILPHNTMWLTFEHGKKINERLITIGEMRTRSFSWQKHAASKRTQEYL